jgi:hypothetical protein
MVYPAANDLDRIASFYRSHALQGWFVQLFKKRRSRSGDAPERPSPAINSQLLQVAADEQVIGWTIT